MRKTNLSKTNGTILTFVEPAATRMLRIVGWVLVVLFPYGISHAQEDVADIPSQDLRVGKDDNKRYFLIGPKKDSQPPKEGYRLVVVLPGGDGSAGMHAFVKRIYKHCLSEKYLVAQLVSVKWTPEQRIVWPTSLSPAARQRFSTEEFVAAVLGDIEKKNRLDKRYLFSLSWSSGGPPAYTMSLQKKTPFTGSYISQSVFIPNRLPPLVGAKGYRYFLSHSPDDRVCPFRMAKEAEKVLQQNGAKVKLVSYAGGHGFRGNIYPRIRDGIKWLESQQQ